MSIRSHAKQVRRSQTLSWRRCASSRQDVENKKLETVNLWQPDKYSQVPNDVMGWVCHKANRLVEVKIVLLIARLSLGFRRSRTIGRLSQDNFAKELNCSPSSVCRAMKRLEQEAKIFKSNPQGDHYYYSLRDPSAIVTGKQSTRSRTGAKTSAIGASKPVASLASTQSFRGGTEHISSVLSQIMKK